MRVLTTIAILFLASTHPVLADVRLWNTSATISGNMGGRVAADAFCDADVNKPVGLSNVRAFISLSGSDEIRDMVGNYAVPGSEEIRNRDDTLTISSNFSGLLNTATVNLDNPVAGSGGSPSPWTFSAADGSLDINNCTGGTSAAGLGTTGNQLLTDDRYLNRSTNSCGNSQALYCLSWNSASAPVAQSIPTTTGWSLLLTAFVMLALLRKRFARLKH
ncbi:hypothetical protein [Pseudoteredinibacter isoporae]|uniref:IPTL-CTERM protein sorting domain-containing protein n=1 Tax=Pseudoteredinibacter isoporae TaxID=570281 RepID=A0A7X0MVD3_9GAMM|nr:hypothetical protein [Pseudoteredinibacter isoporae]MBB6521253.1 hypothetical protein [Pseudoteredinibacter isoporae]NHO86811.1 hypothetical protein [Pseudoteredinibacter isoporae]NIB24737.1 hypothetical protein [Pseudoteredinibacter isoporae]